MARTTGINLDANPQSDGFKLGGGTTKRTVTFTGADMTLTGSGTFVQTMPGASSTLLGIAATATAGSIIFAGSTLMAEDNANFFWDGTNHTLGVGTTRTGAISGTNPGLRIKGTGTTSSTSSFEVQDSGASTLFFVRNDGLVGIGSNAPSAKLQMTGNLTFASWTTSGIGLRIDAATYTDSSTGVSGTVANAGIHAIAQPTIASTSATVTYTNAATLYIANAPANGTNVTVTNAYALWSAAGKVRIDGTLLLNAMTQGSILFAGASGLISQDNSVFFWDDTNNTLGIGTTRTGAISGTNPGTRLKGTGTTSATSSFEVQDSGASTIFFVRDDGRVSIGTNTATSKFHIAGNISLAAWTTAGAGVQVAAITYTDTSTANSGTVANSGIHAFAQPTIASTGTTVTYTNAANVYIAAAPANGTNVTVTNAYALWVAAGLTKLDGGLTVTGAKTTLAATAAGFASLNLPSGTAPSTPGSGDMWWDGTALSFRTASTTVNLLSASLTIGTSVLSGGTTGSVLFVGASSVIQQDNANFFWDDTNNTLGIGTTRTGAISGTNPGVRIKGTGTTSATSSFDIQDSAATTIFFVRNDGLVGIGTGTPGSKLHIAGNLSIASWTTNGVGIQVAAATYTDTSTAISGTVATSGIHVINQPTIAATNTTVTYTSAATLYIANAPANGTNVTVTNAYALWSAAGKVRIDGTLLLNAMTSGSVMFASTSGLISQDNANFFWDGTNHTLGVGTTRTGAISGTNPGVRIKGTGTTSATSSFDIQDSAAATIFFVRNDGLVGIGTGTPGSKLHIAGNLSIASWTTNGVGIQVAAATYTDTSTAISGTVATSGIHVINQPTIAATNTTVTYTSAATLYIANAPANGTNVTVTNAYALWSAAGKVRIDGTLLLNAMTSGSVMFASTSGLISQDNANFFWDGTNHTLGVGTTRTGAISGTNPSMRIKGTGTTSATSSFDIQDSAATTIFFVRNDGLVGIGTGTPGSKLHIAGNLSIASWTTNGVGIQVAAATYTDTSTAISGTVASSGIHTFGQPTIAATNTTVTYTSAATIYIANAPANGTNVTITNKYSLWVAAGISRFDGVISATKAFSSGVATLTDAATIATDASLGNHFRVTLGGNRTLGNPTNPTDGQKCTWEVIQDGTGGRTLAYDTQFAFGSDIPSITLTTGINKRDFIGAIYNATATKWYIVSIVKGY